MIRLNLLILLFLFPHPSHGAQFSFIGPCIKEPLLQTEIDVETEKSLGQLTLEVLTQNNIEFIGSEIGMNSIFNTPTGMDSYEILDKNEMLIYGWCFSINGVMANEYPHKITVKKSDNILWWFGYAHYLNGQWVSQCEPSHKRKPGFLCQ